eukprot:CAMPEP_0175041730 /NCGR_PEP_ID=MMETSP0052_2-20121109/2106_1 /TAXON_ID=51329 ORGANISM="Polytomella parva, Strain SAG 63-3" /NCGR_SAMPLE_ID=MMETSP0052_2 /ASSEMBLY_ACC=CAM_ASM_000194 /LENGTH=561 /DNA_ID=CAMNT_0016304335 /DNA_START=254 /DNA_END=1935 /DNA_ORIENTATION=-
MTLKASFHDKESIFPASSIVSDEVRFVETPTFASCQEDSSQIPIIRSSSLNELAELPAQDLITSIRPLMSSKQGHKDKTIEEVELALRSLCCLDSALLFGSSRHGSLPFSFFPVKDGPKDTERDALTDFPGLLPSSAPRPFLPSGAVFDTGVFPPFSTAITATSSPFPLEDIAHSKNDPLSLSTERRTSHSSSSSSCSSYSSCASMSSSSCSPSSSSCSPFSSSPSSPSPSPSPSSSSPLLYPARAFVFPASSTCISPFNTACSSSFPSPLSSASAGVLHPVSPLTPPDPLLPRGPLISPPTPPSTHCASPTNLFYAANLKHPDAESTVAQNPNDARRSSEPDCNLPIIATTLDPRSKLRSLDLMPGWKDVVLLDSPIRPRKVRASQQLLSHPVNGTNTISQLCMTRQGASEIESGSERIGQIDVRSGDVNNNNSNVKVLDRILQRTPTEAEPLLVNSSNLSPDETYRRRDGDSDSNNERITHQDGSWSDGVMGSRSVSTVSCKDPLSSHHLLPHFEEGSFSPFQESGSSPLPPNPPLHLHFHPHQFPSNAQVAQTPPSNL